MFVNSIDTKPFFVSSLGGEKVRDLTQTMFKLKENNYIKYNVYRVPKDYVMRPDLISKSVYNNSIYAEIILKYNGISNPFSIDEGDIILIPDLGSAKDKIKTESVSDDESEAQKIRNTYKYLDPLKKPKKGDQLKKFDERQIVDTPVESLPPNITEEDTPQVRYARGRVFFGEGAESCLKNGMTKSELLTNVIKNRNREKK